MKESFTINNKIFDLSKVNDHIVRYKVVIASANTTANGFYFSKDVLTSLIPTIKGCPVSTYYDKTTGNYAGHEGDLYKSATGLKRTPYVFPVGFSAYGDDDVSWQTLNLDGQDKEWLCACVYLWKERYPFLDDMSNQVTNQSMELDLNFENRNGIKYVTEASFSGITLIGITPAFDGSKFLKFSKSKSDFNDQVNELKQELTDFEKYSSVNFGIPTNIKEKVNFNNQTTSVCKEFINYLNSNDYITPKKVLDIKKYFSRCNNKSKEFLGGSECSNWINSLMNNIDKINRGDTMAEDFAKKEDWGSGDYSIKVNKSKDSVSNRAWGDVDKTALMNKAIKAKNGKTVIHDIYAEVDDRYEEKPSECLKYPIMEIGSDNEAVYNSGALSAALAYANHPDTGNAEVAKKIIGIQKKLGLDKEDKTSSKEGDKNKMSKKFKKEDKETFAQKFSMTANQIIDAMNNICDEQTFDTDDGKRNKYYISDFDDTYMYGYDCQNQHSVAIPFTVDDSGTFTLDFEHAVSANSVSVWVLDTDDSYGDTEDDDTYSAFAMAKCAKIEKNLSDTKAELSKTKEDLTASQADAGKKFADVTSLETALADEKKISEDRQKQIDELSKQLKASADEQNMSKAKGLMSKKEFNVFSQEIKDEMLKNDSINSYDKFETFAYAELGKFTSTHLDYDTENAKFSFIYTPESTTSNKESKDDDVYTKINKKRNNK